jgi:hypothetical protein
MDELKKYEDYYKPLWEEFLNQIKNVDIENCPEPHLPIYGEYYSTSKYKIVFVGIDTAGSCSMAKYNCEDGYIKIIQDWKKEEFDELNYCCLKETVSDSGWAWKWNFWRFIFQFLSKFYNINLEELKSSKSDKAKNILKSFVWANARSIERFSITAEGKNVNYDNWKKVADASAVFDKAENILRIFKPNILILLNLSMVPDGWFPSEIGEPEILDTNYLRYYYLKNSNTHLYWTKHPRSLTNFGFDAIIHKILQSIKSKNIFPDFPGQHTTVPIIDLITKIENGIREIGEQPECDTVDNTFEPFFRINPYRIYFNPYQVYSEKIFQIKLLVVKNELENWNIKKLEFKKRYYDIDWTEPKPTGGWFIIGSKTYKNVSDLDIVQFQDYYNNWKDLVNELKK